MFKNAPPCFVKLACETGLNILKGNLKLPSSQYKNLRPYKQMLLQLSQPDISIKQRRSILARKKGGFLPLVIPYLLTALSGFAGQAIAKAVF